MKHSTPLAVFFFIFPFLFGVFSFVNAGSYQFSIGTTPPYSGTATYQGLVPCGKCIAVDPPGAPIDILTKRQCGDPPSPANHRYLDCQLCHFFVMADDILDTVMWRIVPSLGFIFFLVAGFFYMMSGDDPMKRKRANDVFKSTIIGIALVYGAWIIINTIFSFTPLINTAFFQTLNPAGWFSIDCPISY